MIDENEGVVPYGGLSSNGKLSAVCSFIECPRSKPCFLSTHQRKEVFSMQFLTHIIFLLNLLKTLINHFS